MLTFDPYPYPSRHIQERASQLISHAAGATLDNGQPHAAGQPTDDELKTILGCIDLTTLEGSDNEKSVAALCRKAVSFIDESRGLQGVAAVCVYPSLVRVVNNELKGTGIKTASVAGAFPSGQSSLRIKLSEVAYALDEGADEIDMVISRGKLLQGSFNEVFDEIAAIKETCGDIHLKAILETGELPTIENIRKASEIAINAGADFIKTSTGKIATGATPGAFLVMLETVKEFLEKTGKSVGLKASGGIRSVDQSLIYYRLTESILGKQWLNKEYFRIGASSLADNVFKALQ